MLASFSHLQGLLVDTAALASVALVGYLFGRRSRRTSFGGGDVKLLIELGRGQSIARSLEHIALRIGAEGMSYLRSLRAFQARVAAMQCGQAAANWQSLRDQADALIGPTMKLTTTLSLSCDELRQQQAQLLTYAGARIDPETGLHNRRSIMEHLEAQLSAHADGQRRLALGLFSVPPPADDVAEAAHLKSVAHLLEQCVRGYDVVARYSSDEFVVLMPKTPLAGGLVFAERLARLFDQQLQCIVWGGLVEASPGESPDKLLARADSALYSARTHDEACLYQHSGSAVRRHLFDVAPRHGAAAEAELVATMA